MQHLFHVPFCLCVITQGMVSYCIVINFSVVDLSVVMRLHVCGAKRGVNTPTHTR